MLNLALLIVALLVTAYLTNYFLVRSFLGFRWRLFVAPGVIIHELSHALGCVLTFAKIKNISFFDKDGGSVTHQKSPIPIIGPIVISIMPLVIGILIFYYLGRFVSLKDLSDVATILSSWTNIIIVYLLLSIAVTMTPSAPDLVNMLWPLVIVAAIFYFFHLGAILLVLIPILTLAIYILLIFLGISLVLYFITKAIFRH